jgi:hypothetical protein
VQDFTGDVNGPVLWNLNLLDAQGNAISETYGNGLWLQNSFDPATGEPLTRRPAPAGCRILGFKIHWYNLSGQARDNSSDLVVEVVLVRADGEEPVPERR